MEFKRKFGTAKKPQPQKGLFLVIVLAIVIFLWWNAEGLMSRFF